MERVGEGGVNTFFVISPALYLHAEIWHWVFFPSLGLQSCDWSAQKNILLRYSLKRLQWMMGIS